MEGTRGEERWSDYDSSSEAEEVECDSPPEESLVIRAMKAQAAARRKRRAGEAVPSAEGEPGESQQKRQRRVYRIETPKNPPPSNRKRRAEEEEESASAGEGSGEDRSKRQRRVHRVETQQDPPPPMSSEDDREQGPLAPGELPAEDEERGAHEHQQLAEANGALFDRFEQEYAQNHERDLAWRAEKEAQEDKDTRDAHYKPALLPLEKEIEKALLLPGEDRDTASSFDTCLLCNSQKLSGVGLVRDNFNMMLRAMMDQICQIAPQVLFKQLHAYFIDRVIVQMREMSHIQRTAAKEKEQTGESGTFGVEAVTDQPGLDDDEEERLRREFAKFCTPFRFYWHFTTHNIDPGLAYLMSIWRQNEIIRIIETECLLERHDLTGRFTFKPDLVLGYTRMLTARKQTYEADTSKMLGFTTQRQLNTSKPNPLINHHRPQFNPHSALNRQVFPVHDSPLLF